VVSADHPGGIELRALFGDDVHVVPIGDPGALAAAILGGLRGGRRTLAETAIVVRREFGPSVVWRRFLDVYEGALAGAGSGTARKSGAAA
jgi:hypothetical protein